VDDFLVGLVLQVGADCVLLALPGTHGHSASHPALRFNGTRADAPPVLLAPPRVLSKLLDRRAAGALGLGQQLLNLALDAGRVLDGVHRLRLGGTKQRVQIHRLGWRLDWLAA